MFFPHLFLQPHSLVRLLYLKGHIHASQGGVTEPREKELFKASKRVRGSLKMHSLAVSLIVLRPHGSSSQPSSFSVATVVPSV